MNQYPILPETGFVRLPTVLQVFPVSRSAWWLGVKEGRYPAAIKLSPRCTAWRAEDIRALIEQQHAEGRQGDASPLGAAMQTLVKDRKLLELAAK